MIDDENESNPMNTPLLNVQHDDERHEEVQQAFEEVAEKVVIQAAAEEVMQLIEETKETSEQLKEEEEQLIDQSEEPQLSNVMLVKDGENVVIPLHEPIVGKAGMPMVLGAFNSLEPVSSVKLKPGFDALKVHKEHVLSPDCKRGPNAAPSHILNNIINIDKTSTLQDRLNPVSSCFKRLSVEDIMKWQKNELQEPLLIMSEEERMFSLQMFRNLLSYMTDRSSAKKPISHAKKFLKLTLHSSPIIKDEAYLQVMKQITNNQRYESRLKGLKFLAILASCFVPSDEIYHLVLHDLFFEIQNSEDKTVIGHCNFIFVRLIKTHESQRKNVPCTEEIELVEYLKQMNINVYFFEEEAINVKFESYTTIGELKAYLVNSLEYNAKDSIYYALYEVCNTSTHYEERYLDDFEKVCDILSLWNRDTIIAQKNNDKIEFRLYFKRIIYGTIDENDTEMLEMIYNQSKYDVITGKYPFKDTEQSITLAALQLLANFGADREAAYKTMQDTLPHYIPSTHMHMHSKIQWMEKIMEIYITLSSYTQTEAKINYLEELKKYNTYQAHLFQAKYDEVKSGGNPDEIPEECIVGIKPEGIAIFDSSKNQIILYKYDVIKNWGVSKDQFIICISYSEGEVKKLSFITNQTTMIQAILEIYCNLIASTPIDKIKESLQKYGATFKHLDIGKKRLFTKYAKTMLITA